MSRKEFSSQAALYVRAKIDLKLVVCPSNGNVRYFLSSFLAPLNIITFTTDDTFNHIIVVKAKKTKFKIYHLLIFLHHRHRSISLPENRKRQQDRKRIQTEKTRGQREENRTLSYTYIDIGEFLAASTIQ